MHFYFTFTAPKIYWTVRFFFFFVARSSVIVTHVSNSSLQSWWAEKPLKKHNTLKLQLKDQSRRPHSVPLLSAKNRILIYRAQAHQTGTWNWKMVTWGLIHKWRMCSILGVECTYATAGVFIKKHLSRNWASIQGSFDPWVNPCIAFRDGGNWQEVLDM